MRRIPGLTWGLENLGLVGTMAIAWTSVVFASADVRVVDRRIVMGGTASIQVYAEDEASGYAATRAAFERMAVVEAALSDYRPKSEARRLYMEVIEGFTASLGASHNLTLMAKMNLANLLMQIGEQHEARRLYEEVIEGSTESLGASHTRTLTAKGNLADLLTDLRERDEARRVYMEVIEGYTESLGASHTNTQATKYNLCCLESLEGNFDAALVLIEDYGNPAWAWADEDLAPLRLAREADFVRAIGAAP